MKNIVLKLSLLVLFSIFIISCEKDEDVSLFEEYSSKEVEKKIKYSQLEKDILTLVNDYRNSLGLSELMLSDVISSVALSHSTHMSETGKASHDNFSSRFNSLKQSEMAKNVGENVAFGYSTAKGVFTSWLQSEGHKEIIEKPYFTHFGIAVVSDMNNRNYFTNIFISKN